MKKSNTKEAVDKIAEELKEVIDTPVAIALQEDGTGVQLALKDILGFSQDYIVRAYEQYDAWHSGTPWEDEVHVSTVLWAKPDSAWSLLNIFPREVPFGYIIPSNASTATYEIVLRGTRSPDEWWTDSLFEQTASPIGAVHKGFYDVAAQLADDIETFFKAVPVLERPILQIHGHSLGGGVGKILAALLALQGWNVVAILWAAPRALSNEAAAIYARLVPDTLRIVNTEDVVPTGPLPVLGEWIYTHVGILIAFTLNTGTLSGNHSMDTYGKGIGTPQSQAKEV